MSPSAFLQVEKVRGMAPSSTPPGLGKPNPLEPQAKSSPEEAAYGDSTARCSSCVHFDGTNACDKVDGEIDPEGHSKYYERGETTTDNDADDTVGSEYA